MGTEDAAFSRLAAIGPSPAERARHAEINRGIDATMREVIRGAKYNPNSLDMPISKVTPVGAVVAKAVGERWVEPVPMVTAESRATDAHVQRIADALAPHGPGNPLAAVRERRGPAAEAAFARAVAEARAAPAGPEPVAEEPQSQAPLVAEPEPVAYAPEPKAVLVAGTLTRRRLA